MTGKLEEAGDELRNVYPGTGGLVAGVKNER